VLTDYYIFLLALLTASVFLSHSVVLTKGYIAIVMHSLS